MGTRRLSREHALQALFYADISHYDKTTSLKLFLEYFPPKKNSNQFFQRLVEGVWEHGHDIDRTIKEHSNNWQINRMSYVDRNILRFATFEILHCKDIPPRVSINEAVEVGKRFGTEDSGAFINAILDSIYLAIINKDSSIDEVLLLK